MSSSPSRSPIHHASLVDSSLHSPTLLDLLETKVSPAVIGYVIECVLDTVDYAMGRPSSSSSHGLHLPRRSNPAFTAFVNNVITRAEITFPIILATLVYIDKAKSHLHIALEEWAAERVFLGALIVASKYLNDSTLKNLHWAMCTGVFGKRDVGRIEREFLDVLDFQLGIAEHDLLAHHDGLLAVTRPSHIIHQNPTPAALLHPTLRPHYRQRSTGVPDLTPSSPESSSDSSSYPSTPSTLDMLSPRSTSPGYAKAKAQVYGEPPERPKNSSLHLSSSTLDLLSAFPVPTSHHHARKVATRSRKNAMTAGLPVVLV